MKRLVVLVVAFVVGGTAVALAAGKTVSLKIQGTQSTAQAKCGTNADAYALFKPRATVFVAGSVAPKPKKALWLVKVEVKQCVNGAWTTVRTLKARGKADGTFRASYLASKKGNFFVRALYGKHPQVESAKQRFAVR